MSASTLDSIVGLNSSGELVCSNTIRNYSIDGGREGALNKFQRCLSEDVECEWRSCGVALPYTHCTLQNIAHCKYGSVNIQEQEVWKLFTPCGKASIGEHFYFGSLTFNDVKWTQ